MMVRVKRHVILALFALFVSGCATSQTKSLFNGKDLAGWEGDSRLWSVRDGVIHGETSAEKAAQGNTFLI